MRIIVCILVTVGMAAGQIDPAGAPLTAEALPASTAQGSPATAALTAQLSPASAAAAGKAAVVAAHNYGPAFYGPGLNNPAATKPNLLQISLAQQLVRRDPKTRVFVDEHGIITLTDEYGRPRTDLEGIIEPTEVQEQARELRIQQMEQQMELQEQQRQAQLSQANMNKKQKEQLLVRLYRINPLAFSTLFQGYSATALAAAAAGIQEQP